MTYWVKWRIFKKNRSDVDVRTTLYFRTRHRCICARCKWRQQRARARAKGKNATFWRGVLKKDSAQKKITWRHERLSVRYFQRDYSELWTSFCHRSIRYSNGAFPLNTLLFLSSCAIRSCQILIESKWRKEFNELLRPDCPPDCTTSNWNWIQLFLVACFSSPTSFAVWDITDVQETRSCKKGPWL